MQCRSRIRSLLVLLYLAGSWSLVGCGDDGGSGTPIDDAGSGGQQGGGDGDAGDGDAGDGDVGDGDAGNGDAGDGDVGDGDAGDGDVADSGMLDAGPLTYVCEGGALVRIADVTATTDMGELGDATIDKIVDGSGLSALSNTATHDCTEANTWKSSAGVKAGKVDFDLGAMYELTELAVWNHFQVSGDRGVRGVNVSTSEDGETYELLQLVPTDLLFSKVVSCPPANDAQSFPLSEPRQARYVRFDIADGWGAGSSNVGLAEVVFGGVPCVAE